MIPRYKVYFSLTVCVLLLNTGVGASIVPAVVNEAAEEHLKDVAHNEGAESIKQENAKGEKIHQIESLINDSHKNQHSRVNDEGKYLTKDRNLKSAQESDAYEGYNNKQDKLEDSQANGYKRGHKKGHHKQGFQNSYHKDESSNKSTFFDDFNDEGDQAAYNQRLNSYDNQGGRSYKGANNHGQEYEKDNYQGGGYQRYDDSGVKHAGHQDYGKNYHVDDQLQHTNYADNRNVYDRNNVHDRRQYHAPPPPPPPLPPPVHRPPPPLSNPGWDWQKWENSRKGWDDRDYGGPGYYDDRGLRHDGGYGYGYGYGESRNDPVAQIPRNAPVVAHRKQSITIYEDPRYDGTDRGQLRREEGDYLELDYRPSGGRYATYDDVYYNAPPPSRESAGMESSKINRLVYNYRRQ